MLYSLWLIYRNNRLMLCDICCSNLNRFGPRAESIGAPFLVAIVYVGLRDRDNALLWLERAAGTTETLGRIGLYGLESSIYDWLREDDRFDNIRLAAHSRQLDSAC